MLARCLNATQEILGSIPTWGKIIFFGNVFVSLDVNILQNCQLCSITEKTRISFYFCCNIS